MKDYLNMFYGMIDKIDNWDSLDVHKKKAVLSNFTNKNADTSYLVDYFDKYKQNLLNSTLNFHIKGVINN